MTARFDPDQGRLVMSRATLHGLAALGAGASDDLVPEVKNELVDAGIAPEGRVHERLASLARCLSATSVRLVVERAPRPAIRVEGWIDDRIAVLLHLPDHAHEGDVVAVPRSMVGFRLARLMQVGPRPTHKVGSLVEIDAGLLEVLLTPGSSFGPDDVERLSRPGDDLQPAWAETLAAMSRTEVDRWTAGVWWNAPHERPTARTLEFLDSAVGMFLVTLAERGDRSTRRLALRPLTPSQLWRLLCALVPPEGEVSEPTTGW